MIIVNGWKLFTIITELYLGCCSSPRSASVILLKYCGYRAMQNNLLKGNQSFILANQYSLI